MRGLVALTMFFLPTLLFAETLKARLEWVHTVDLRSLEDGVVETVSVLEGQVVNKGDYLVMLESTDFDIDVKAANSQLVLAKATLDKVTRDVDLTRELYDRGLISENERQDAEVAFQEGKALVDSAEAGVEKAKLSLTRSIIKAPFDGMVVSVNAWQGQVIVRNLQQSPLVTLADSGNMVARARTSAAEVGKYLPGQPAQVQIGDVWRDGHIYRIGAVSEGVLERGVAYAIDVRFELNDGEIMRPGQFSNIRVNE